MCITRISTVSTSFSIIASASTHHARQRVSRRARFYSPTGRSRVYRLTRIPSSSLKFRSASMCPLSPLPHYLLVSPASSSASRANLRVDRRNIYSCASRARGRKNIIPQIEESLKYTYMTNFTIKK